MTNTEIWPWHRPRPPWVRWLATGLILTPEREKTILKEEAIICSFCTVFTRKSSIKLKSTTHRKKKNFMISEQGKNWKTNKQTDRWPSNQTRLSDKDYRNLMNILSKRAKYGEVTWEYEEFIQRIRIWKKIEVDITELKTWLSDKHWIDKLSSRFGRAKQN